MAHENRKLDQLFAPPDGMYGTNLLLCGLSADIATLEQIMLAFTAETRSQRGASGMVRGLLMLDASQRMGSPLAVPGITRLPHRSSEHWTAHTSLMHAKVALMGFAAAPFDTPSIFRLVVSTGNWTATSWGPGSQIDLHWSADCAAGPAGHGTQQQRDAAAALTFFRRMMGSLYPDSSEFLQLQRLASAWLQDWDRLLPRGRGPRQFIHSIDKALFAQIRSAFPAKIKTLVAGSGFYEQSGQNPALKPAVLARLEELSPSATRYLVLNAANAGALAGWARAWAEAGGGANVDGWTLCAPRDPAARRGAPGRTALHAKYIAALGHVRDTEEGIVNALYLGSGNLSRAGLLGHGIFDSAAPGRRAAGNIEAGVCVVGEQTVKHIWKALACGDELSVKAMSPDDAGTGEEILLPLDPPPVIFALVVDSHLQLVRSAGSSDALEVRSRPDEPWRTIGAAEDRIGFDGVAPPVIWVRKAPEAEHTLPEVVEVPVFSGDGALCRQPPPEMNVDDVMEALLAFPQAPADPGEADDPGAKPRGGGASASASARNYPLHVLATMIEVIARRNCDITPAQFPFWLNQLRSLLLEQVTPADRSALRDSGVNLFGALREPGFVPDWLDHTPDLQSRYLSLLHDIEAAWVLTPSITPSGDDHAP